MCIRDRYMGSLVLDRKEEKLSKFSSEAPVLADMLFGAERFNTNRQYGYGIDILRLWIASTDITKKENPYTYISNVDLDTKNSEIKLLRQIYWEILRFTEKEPLRGITFDELTPVDQYFYYMLCLWVSNITQAYQELDYSKVYRLYMDLSLIHI
eukprot:TRINITY_DN20279_c0_g1_i1.p1 TRINITY_DN20279_c0_g1~~TRINITY_DN20279_c0_g1_i1.p1  ORF type:complete len:154 (-),score=18.56 TRINITY_DN20279_c0_g1_i1:59-520(-)